MSEADKIKVLEQNGWHQYYSKTHWVHPDIFTYFNKANKGYFGSDYTNFQYTVDEAIEIETLYLSN